MLLLMRIHTGTAAKEAGTAVAREEIGECSAGAGVLAESPACYRDRCGPERWRIIWRCGELGGDAPSKKEVEDREPDLEA